jgi:hypothetical protein
LKPSLEKRAEGFYMAEAAEAVQSSPGMHTEQYARSLELLRQLGSSVLDKTVNVEALPVWEQARINCESALCEMLRTDGEFNEQLDIDGQREFDVIDGQACDVDGQPIVGVVERGWQTSTARAKKQPEFSFQATRDKGDVYTAEQADKLEDGETYFALSMDPKKALKEHPEIAKDELGYREGLLYIQRYSKVGDTLVAGYCSVDMSDEHTWRQLLAKQGVFIPEGESPDTWITHGFKRKMDPEQASDFTLDLRDQYYEQIGMHEKRYSVSEYVGQRKAIVDGYFAAYYPSLSEAIHTGENNSVLQGLARNILMTDISNMKAAAKMQLMQVARTEDFNDDLGKAMEVVIRYGIVEELRKGLKAIIVGEQSESRQAYTPFVVQESGTDFVPTAEMLSQRMAQNVESGVRAGRSYGGCAGQASLVNEANAQNNGLEPGSLQQPYGGRSESGYSKAAKINCRKCRVPVRIGEVEQEDSHGKVKSWRCPHCKYEVDICTKEVKNEGESPEEKSPQLLDPAKTPQAALGKKMLEAV